MQELQKKNKTALEQHNVSVKYTEVCRETQGTWVCRSLGGLVYKTAVTRTNQTEPNTHVHSCASALGRASGVEGSKTPSHWRFRACQQDHLQGLAKDWPMGFGGEDPRRTAESKTAPGSFSPPKLEGRLLPRQRSPIRHGLIICLFFFLNKENSLLHKCRFLSHEVRITRVGSVTLGFTFPFRESLILF